MDQQAPEARLRARQDVDARRRLIVLGSEWILIDTNLANRILRRQIAAGKSVDEDLPAVWSNRWTSKRLKRGCELVRIVRKRIEIFSANHGLVGVVGGFRTDRARVP